MFVVLVPGNASANGTENAVMRHRIVFLGRQPDTAARVLLPANRIDGPLPIPHFVQEEEMRTFVLVALVSVVLGVPAFADETVSGTWRADMGSGVVINMNVSADGGWSSETLQKDQVVRQMRGTYKQTSAKNGTGTLVFTPTQATVKKGPVQVETDKYELGEDGKQLKLTSDGDTMVFEKRAQ